MSAELHKYIEKAIDKNKNLLNTEIIKVVINNVLTSFLIPLELFS